MAKSGEPVKKPKQKKEKAGKKEKAPPPPPPPPKEEEESSEGKRLLRQHPPPHFCYCVSFTTALWFRIAINRVLGHSLVPSLLLSHRSLTLAPDCSLCSRASLRSFICSLVHSLIHSEARGKMQKMSQNDLALSHCVIFSHFLFISS